MQAGETQRGVSTETIKRLIDDFETKANIAMIECWSGVPGEMSRAEGLRYAALELKKVLQDG